VQCYVTLFSRHYKGWGLLVLKLACGASQPRDGDCPDIHFDFIQNRSSGYVHRCTAHHGVVIHRAVPQWDLFYSYTGVVLGEQMMPDGTEIGVKQGQHRIPIH